MGFTDKLRAQHEELLALVSEITAQLKKKEPDAPLIRKHLSALAGKLNFHLAMEDKALYPRLMQQEGSSTHVLASRFLREMGGLGQAFMAYNSKWQVSAIRADVPGFAEETRKIFGALAHRIGRENSELYPLADAAP